MKAKIILMLITLLTNTACSVFGIRSEETPSYQVLMSDGNKEIRSYAPYIVAKTVVQGEYRTAQTEGFRILAGYIFGSNEQKQNISMTAPVVQESRPQSQKIAMTAPVVQESQKEGWVMTFMMPSKYTMADLPKPKDSRVILEQVPAKIIATIRFSGSRAPKNNSKKGEELLQWLQQQKSYKVVSGPSTAGFDPPWTIPWFRRNEVHYEVQKVPAP
jgi:hypothetical protein